MVGIDSIMNDLLVPDGVLGKIKPDKNSLSNIKIGIKAALSIGVNDVGQAVIVQESRVLGVEAAEGTDELMRRCKNLHTEGEAGVLVKMKKPQQDPRIDLPTIGPNTVDIAVRSGLRGIAAEAGATLIVNKEEVIKLADSYGIFVIGVKSSFADN